MYVCMYGGRGKQSQKFSFLPFGPQFGLKMRGRGEPPGPLPWIRNWFD